MKCSIVIALRTWPPTFIVALEFEDEIRNLQFNKNITYDYQIIYSKLILSHPKEELPCSSRPQPFQGSLVFHSPETPETVNQIFTRGSFEKKTAYIC